MLTVTRVTALNKVQDLLLGESTGRRGQLEGPQEIAGLLEVWANGEDLMNQVFNANDAVLAQFLLDDGVIGESDTLLVDLAVTALVHQFTDRLQVGVTESNERLDHLEHLHGAVVQADENTRVDLTQAKQLQDLAGFWAHLVDTLDTDNESELGLGRNVKVSEFLGLTTQTDFVLLGGLVFLSVLFSALENDLALRLLFLYIDMRFLIIIFHRYRNASMRWLSPERWYEMETQESLSS